MKLKTRILLISGIAVFMATLISDVIILTLYKKSALNEAYSKSYQNTFIILNEYQRMKDSNAKLADNNSYVEYFFKTKNDYYNICVRGSISSDSGKLDNSVKYVVNNGNVYEVYNHTVLKVDDLFNYDYYQYENEYSEYIKYANVNRDGKHYAIFSCELSEDIRLFRIEDISYVWTNMEWLTLSMIFISTIVIAVTIGMLSVILRRLLRPLQKLNETTKHIAEGYYDQRLEINKMDEIGQLGENFNRMVDAVEIRTNSLEESEMRKTLFMGNLTHELKTPMTAISGYAQTLRTMKISDEDREEALMYIYEECGRLDRLSRKMMKLLEIDHEEDLEMTDISVGKIFEAACKSCSVILKEKNIILECFEEGEVFHVEADMMTDVVINLIDNAVKASESGSKIVLSAGKDYIEVQDFGKGIPRDEQDKILEPFYMIDKSRSRKSGGAGLGLALIAVIAEKHNMTLKIESQVGTGTKMILQFV